MDGSNRFSFKGCAVILLTAAILTVPTSVGALLTSAPPPRTDNIGCNSPVTAPSLTGGLLLHGAGESLQHKNWQPPGGDIPFVLKLPPGTPNGAKIRVCFRWEGENVSQDFIEGSVRIDSRDAQGNPTIVTTVPSNLPSPPSWPLTATLFKKDAYGVYTGLGLVPVADVRIMILSDTAIVADVTTAIGVTSMWWGAAVAILSVLIVFVFMSHVCAWKTPSLKNVNPLLRIIATPSGYASLSQFQIFVWTLVIGASAVYVMALSGELVTITTGALILLGISGVSVLTAQFQSANAPKTAGTATDPKADAAPPSAPGVAPEGAPPVPANRPVDSRKTIESGHTPAWSDLVVADGQVDVTRLQMFYFTIIAAAFVVMSVVTSYEIPEIPQGFLLLMGISNGVYVGSKFTPRPSQAPAAAPP
jgi:hypothetical protein